MNQRSAYLAVVPGRGGSEGIPGKNLRTVQGMSLVARAVLVAGRVPEIAWVVVSTDDDAIAEEGRRAGAEVPFRRPYSLSRSCTPMVEVLEHTYAWFCASFDAADPELDGIVLLAPTSPMRKVVHIREAISVYRQARKGDPSVAAVHTVSPVPGPMRTEHHWKKVAAVDCEHRVNGAYFERRLNIDDRSVYYRNGAAVVLDPKRLDALNLKSGTVLPYVIEEALISIDCQYDLERAEHCGRLLEPDPAEVDWKDRPARGILSD